MADDRHRLLALCALRHPDGRIDWSLLAREAVRFDGLDRLYRGEVIESSAEARRSLPLLRDALATDLARATQRVEHEMSLAEKLGARLVTVLDEDFPTNLRLIPNLPPFLFLVGAPIDSSDIRSVAVVGTRKPSPRGLDVAAQMARQLTDHRVTVISGLAAGIDAAAHRATLDAGGRTIAVIGTGITRTYPRENRALSDEIAKRGTLVSQFWPSSPPATWTFPRRNVVMSGLAQGTVVIEASSTSGAKMQARLAVEHGKQVFLVSSLVTSQEWARRYVDKRGAIEVATVEDVIRQLRDPERIESLVDTRQQLTLDLL
jgi:DNA processing protein